MRTCLLILTLLTAACGAAAPDDERAVASSSADTFGNAGVGSSCGWSYQCSADRALVCDGGGFFCNWVEGSTSGCIGHCAPAICSEDADCGGLGLETCGPDGRCVPKPDA